MNKLTFAYWVKEENSYIPEWIEFHKLQGVDHFILYENGPAESLKEICKPYLDQGILEVRTYPKDVINRNNFWMMSHLVREQVGKTEWLHFGATDERVFSPTGGSLPDILKDYSRHGGLCVAWEEFGSSGHLKKVPGLITDRFTTTVKDTAQHIKTIIRPECVLNHEGDPHNFVFGPGFESVDENHIRVNGPWNNKNPYTFNKIKNHHYRTMSREEYDVKMNKGLLDHAGQENVRRYDAEQQWDWVHVRGEQGLNVELVVWSAAVKHNLRETYKDYPELYKVVRGWYDL